MSKKSAFLVAVLDVLRARLPEPERALAAAFTRQFWARIPESEIGEHEAGDAAGVTIAALRLFASRRPKEVTVVVRNPEPGPDGFGSRHTAIFIVHRDMPFITDSVLMLLSHHDLVAHHLQNVVFDAVRDDAGRLVGLEPGAAGATSEALIFAEIDRLEPARHDELRQRIAATLADVRAVVDDFAAMKAHTVAIRRALSDTPPPVPVQEATEAIAFLDWLGAANFTFLGYREFDFGDGVMRQVPGSALGLLRNREPSSERALAEQSDAARTFLLAPRVLAFSKSGTRSTVHRPAYPDYVGVKRFDAQGRVVGEHGFLGMYTSVVYTERPERIPVLRQKVASVKARSGLRPDGFDGKVLSQVLATYPRDELFQTEENELLATALAITYIHERRRTRVFVRRDPYGLFCSCLVFLPRELYHTTLRVRIQRLLCEVLDAEDAPFDVHFSESILVRLHFTIRIEHRTGAAVDVSLLERRIVELARDWGAQTRRALANAAGEVDGRRIAARWLEAFPAAYRDAFEPEDAVADIASMDRLSLAAPINLRLARPAAGGEARLKVLHLGGPLPLSDMLPALENLGLRVVSEHPFALRAGELAISIQDLVLDADPAVDLAPAAARFEDAFLRVWSGDVDDDGFNRLVLRAGLDWREVTVLRAYAHYLKQIQVAFSQPFIADTLVRHSDVAASLIAYFRARFDPDGVDDGAVRRTAIVERLDRVALLNEDRVLRRLLELVDATVRTSFFQAPTARPRLVFKFDTGAIRELPQPVPMAEIFVFSARVEGVHLRAGRIARGGLRWSDRHEDYRTEVLGLVKAQIVKNALIVPTGAKGAFVVRGRDVDGHACYREFVEGLLDVTDDVVSGRVTPPPRVRRRDGDDPYLVVAADKGTATFSDTANTAASARGFWLGDAFASGGSNGYDHKRLGITARGAWIAVERHFAERGIDPNRDPVTVLGIGDMSGDVFGNGLLRSRSVRLVAAFDHRHIFVDPDPDPASSFEERARLFALPRSSWADYDRRRLSAGGDIYSRDAKTIRLSPEACRRLALEPRERSPEELIRSLLCAPVDLIWNGGIGTYVKASTESHAAVGDRTNDGVRIDAGALRARVFAEGGNLGMTQRARVEFALAGGGVNADFIDNCAGVDCSDHEVNLKILLDQCVAEGTLAATERNALLSGWADDVAALVLTNSYRQVQTLSIAELQVRFRATEYGRFVSRMEAEVRFDREREGIPTDERLAARAAAGAMLTRPELAVLLSYAKIHLHARLVDSDVGEDAVVGRALFDAFPAAVEGRFADAARRHPLAREIVATMVANDIVHHLGITAAVHLAEFVGGDVDDIARAYFAAAASFALRERFREVEALEAVDAATRIEMLLELVQLGRRATRWLLRHRRGALDVAALVARLRPQIEALLPLATGLFGAGGSRRREALLAARLERGVPRALAAAVSNAAALAVTLPIIDAAAHAGHDATAVGTIFANLNATLGFDALAEQIMALPASTLWQAMERDALIDELVTVHAALAAAAFSAGGVDAWLARDAKGFAAWRQAMEQALRAGTQDFALYSMTLRRLSDVARALGCAR